jgi:hypothetical protein
MSSIAYATTCVVLPAAWGAAMAYVFGLIERRRKRKNERASGDPPPIDYTI